MEEHSIPPTVHESLDACCGRFTDAWRSGPRLEAFLPPPVREDAGQRARYLRELIPLDVHYRKLRGEEPALSDYVAMFPHDDDLIRGLFNDTDRSFADNSTLMEGDDSAEVTTTDPASDSARFRILCTHARGGLGQVFRAYDTELKREVALKQIQFKYATHESARKRFALEAEVTGQLEHPGIVPVYSLGVDTLGSLYYAMRFIHGDSLLEAIRRFHDGRSRDRADHDLEMRQLLGRFVQVCNAIAYAHSRDVIHRDLKPQNIMLGEFGETLVVDWGLAKRLGGAIDSRLQPERRRPLDDSIASGSHTQPGEWLGTPAYMSPEQAAGDLAEVGPASDVYALGATLYHLLTGKPPTEGAEKIEQALERIRYGQIPPPRSRLISIPRGLDAICRKAMSLQPQDRYASAQALGEDVERFLADERVQAHRESVGQRLSRWSRKHRTWTQAAATALVLVALVSATAAVLVNEQRALAVAQRGKAQELAIQEREARQLADVSAQAAREQSELALSTLSAVVFDVQASLKNLAGGSNIRRRLLTTALARLESVADEYLAGTGQKDRATIAALLNLGDVVMELGDPEPVSISLDSPADQVNKGPLNSEMRSAVLLSRTLYEQALKIAEERSNADPGDLLALDDVATLYGRLGGVHRRLGDVQQMLDSFQRALQLNKMLEESQPDLPNVRGVINASIGVGDARLSGGELQEAFQAYDEALQRSRLMVEAHPHLDEDQQHLSNSLERVATFLEHTGRPSEAEGYFEEMLRIKQTLFDKNPNDLQARRDLALAHLHEARVQFEMGDIALSIASTLRSLEILRQSIAQEPNDYQAQHDLSSAYSMLGERRLINGETADAISAFAESLRISQHLLDLDPADARQQRQLAVNHLGVGDAQVQKGELRLALDSYQRTASLLTSLTESDNQNAANRRDLAIAQSKLGEVHLTLGDLDEARLALEASVEIGERRAAENQDDALARQGLSIHYLNLGAVYLQSEELDLALTAFQECLALMRELADADPRNLLARRNLAMPYERLGDLHLHRHEPDLALDNYQASLKIAQQLHAAVPTHPELRRDLSIAWEKTGDLHHALGESQAALDDYRTSLEIRERLVAADPGNAVFQRDLSVTHRRLGSRPHAIRCTAAGQGSLSAGPEDLAATLGNRLSKRTGARRLDHGLFPSWRSCISAGASTPWQHNTIETQWRHLAAGLRSPRIWPPAQQNGKRPRSRPNKPIRRWAIGSNCCGNRIRIYPHCWRCEPLTSREESPTNRRSRPRNRSPVCQQRIPNSITQSPACSQRRRRRSAAMKSRRLHQPFRKNDKPISSPRSPPWNKQSRAA